MRLVITEAIGENKDMTPVALTQRDDIGQAITRALSYLEVEPLIRGKVVAVKPNDLCPDKEVQGPQKSVMVNPRVLTYETIVVVSQLKMHDTATVTLALKNIAMSFPAADYYGHPRTSQHHKNHFYEEGLYSEGLWPGVNV